MSYSYSLNVLISEHSSAICEWDTVHLTSRGFLVFVRRCIIARIKHDLCHIVTPVSRTSFSIVRVNHFKNFYVITFYLECYRSLGYCPDSVLFRRWCGWEWSIVTHTWRHLVLKYIRKFHIDVSEILSLTCGWFFVDGKVDKGVISSYWIRFYVQRILLEIMSD